MSTRLTHHISLPFSETVRITDVLGFIYYFLLRVLSRRTTSTTQSASQREIESAAQVRKSRKNEAIRLLQLYPSEMNIYGDWGNTLTIKKRLEWRGYKVELIEHHPGGEFPKDVDIIVGGGGQDSGQDKIQDDLLKIAYDLKELADTGVPMLMICGMYQLFGRFFITDSGDKIEGIGIFDAETTAGSKRLIGNIITHSSEFGDIVGYENHSGLTVLGKSQKPLAKVVSGAGNNGKDGSEGAIYINVMGTYLHGSLLPKNPKIADWLIFKAIERKFNDKSLENIDDTLAEKAREVAQGLGR